MVELPSYNLNDLTSTFGKPVKVSRTIIGPQDRHDCMQKFMDAKGLKRVPIWLERYERFLYHHCTVDVKTTITSTTSSSTTSFSSSPSIVRVPVEGLPMFSSLTFQNTAAGYMSSIEHCLCAALGFQVPLEHVKINGVPLRFYLYSLWIEFETFLWDRTWDHVVRMIESKPVIPNVPASFSPLTMTRPYPRFHMYKYTSTMDDLIKVPFERVREMFIKNHFLLDLKSLLIKPSDLYKTTTECDDDSVPVPTGTVSSTTSPVSSTTTSTTTSTTSTNPATTSEPKKRGIFSCPKCKSYDVDVVQVQTRSADEAMTNFCKCRKCKHQFRRS